jgi:hypothetical protein
MAEILALPISRYPPLSGHNDRMATILQRMLQNPDLPSKLRTPEGMRAEWGDGRPIPISGWSSRT